MKKEGFFPSSRPQELSYNNRESKISQKRLKLLKKEVAGFLYTMKILFYTVLVLTLPVFLECINATIKYKRSVGLKKTLQKIIQRESLDAGDGLVISSSVIVLCLLLSWKQIGSFIAPLSENIQAGIIKQEDINIQDVQPTVVYENQNFGSTINKLLVHKVFEAGIVDAASHEIPFGLNTDDLETQSQRSRFIANSTKGDLLFYQTPLNTYNQFSGDYEARLTLKISEDSTQPDPLFEIVVFDPSQNRRIARKIVMTEDFFAVGSYQTFSLPFYKPNVGSAVQIQVRSSGKASLWLDTVEIVGTNVDMRTLEVPDLFPDVPDTQASEGSARLGDPTQHLPGTMLFGPYDKSLDNGDYVAAFRIKTDNVFLNQPIIRLQTANLQEGSGAQQIETYEVKGTDFQSNMEYQDFFLPVSKTKDGYVEFRTYFYDLSRVWIDYVKLYPALYFKNKNIKAPSAKQALWTLENKPKPEIQSGSGSVLKGVELTFEDIAKKEESIVLPPKPQAAEIEPTETKKIIDGTDQKVLEQIQNLESQIESLKQIIQTQTR